MAYPDDYSQYDQITINHTIIGSGGVNHFDIWLPVTLMSSTAQSVMRSDGGDLRVTLDDGTTQLPREVIQNSLGEVIGLRINMPSLSDSTDDVIRCWYNGSDVEPSANSTYGQHNVYDSDTAGYWPMEELPSGIAPQILDHTSNLNHGTVVGGMTADKLVAGIIGNGLNMAGNGYIQLVDNGILRNRNVLSFSAKFRIHAGVSVFGFLVEKGNTSEFSLESTNSLTPKFYVNNTLAVSLPTLSTQIDYHFVLVLDGSTAYGYLNGSQFESRAFGVAVPDNSNDIGFAARPNSSYYFNGLIDDYRIDHTARSAAWISTRYQNDANPNSFFSSVTAQGHPPVTTGSRQFPCIGSSIIRGANL